MNVDYDPQAGFKANLGQWLFAQGVSTVLLVLIGVGIYVRAPQLMKQIQAGYEQNAEAHKEIAKSYKEAVDTHAQTAETILEAHSRDERESQRLVVELLKRAPNMTAEEFTEAVEAATEPEK